MGIRSQSNRQNLGQSFLPKTGGASRSGQTSQTAAQGAANPALSNPPTKQKLTSFLSKLEATWQMFNRSTLDSDEGQLPRDGQMAYLGDDETPTPEHLKRLRQQVMNKAPKPRKGAGSYLKGSASPSKGQPKDSPGKAQNRKQSSPSQAQSRSGSQPSAGTARSSSPRPGGTPSSKAFLGTASSSGAKFRHSTATGKPGAAGGTTATRQPVYSQTTARVNRALTRRSVSGAMPVHSNFLDEYHDQQKKPSMKGLRLSWVSGKNPLPRSPARRALARAGRMRLPTETQGGRTLGNPISLQSQAAAMATARTELVARMAGKAIGSLLKKLYEEEELEELDEETAVNGLGLILRLGGDFTYEHSTRVLELAMDLADEVGIEDKETRREIQHGVVLRDIGEFDLLLQGGDEADDKLKKMGDFLGSQDMLKAGLLHDIGKVNIPPEILYKPGKLTPEEYDLIKMHPIYGEEIVRPIAALRHLCPTIRGHHERWDGQGYPDGLAGEEIPLPARVIAVADVFDALAADRPYKRGMEVSKIETILEEGRGTHFDPTLVDAFLRVIERRFPFEDDEVALSDEPAEDSQD